MLDFTKTDFDPGSVPDVPPEIRAAVEAAQASRNTVSRLLAKIDRLQGEHAAKVRDAEALALRAEICNQDQKAWFNANKEADLLKSDIDRATAALAEARRQTPPQTNACENWARRNWSPRGPPIIGRIVIPNTKANVVKRNISDFKSPAYLLM